ATSAVTSAAPSWMRVLVAMRPPSKAVQTRPSRRPHGPLTASAARLVIDRATSYKESVAEFRILGPLEVVAADGEPLALGGQRQRAVLALLLLHANRVVSTELLVDSLWGEQPPRTATTSLQNAIVALRKVLGPEVLETRAPGYVLHVAPDDFDLARFERLVAAARGLESAEKAEALREALALWRGEALAELPVEAFTGEQRRLEELRLAATEDRIDAE